MIYYLNSTVNKYLNNLTQTIIIIIIVQYCLLPYIFINHKQLYTKNDYNTNKLKLYCSCCNRAIKEKAS